MQHWTTLTDKRHREPEPLPYIDLLYSTAVNTRSRCVEQPWGRLFQLRCRGNCDATRWGRALATCRQTIPLWLRYVDDTYRRLQRRNWRFSPLPCQTERRHPVYQRSRIKWKTFFSRLFGKLRQQRGTSGSVQKTDATDRLFDESSYNRRTGSSLTRSNASTAGFLHWCDWQKSLHATDWKRTSYEKWWC